MKIDWREPGSHPFGMVINVDTGNPISGPDGYCCYVDEEAGEWKRYKCINHKPVIGPDGCMVIEEGKGNVRFLQNDMVIAWERERCACIVDSFDPTCYDDLSLLASQIRSGHVPPIMCRDDSTAEPSSDAILERNRCMWIIERDKRLSAEIMNDILHAIRNGDDPP
jgi:hypothetical protein